MLYWRHTGFHVHAKVRTESKKETERVGKYMIRPILSLKRLSLDKTQEQLVYQYGNNSTEAESMDYLKFIAWSTLQRMGSPSSSSSALRSS
ncbi:MAG: transposase [Acidobacteriota bacterium]